MAKRRGYWSAKGKGKPYSSSRGYSEIGIPSYGGAGMKYSDVEAYIDSLRRKGKRKETDYDVKNDILRDFKAAESMLRRGIMIGGNDIEDAVHLYNFAIEDAKAYGDQTLAKQMYDKGKTMLKKGYRLTRTQAKKRDEGFFGENPRIKLGKLERSMRMLKDPNKGEREDVLDMVFFSIFLVITIVGALLSFPGITGAVIGEGSENFYGLIVFLSFLIALYFFYRKKI